MEGTRRATARVLVLMVFDKPMVTRRPPRWCGGRPSPEAKGEEVGLPHQDKVGHRKDHPGSKPVMAEAAAVPVEEARHIGGH